MGEQERDEITPLVPVDGGTINPMIRTPSGDFIDLRAIKATKKSDYGKLIVLFSNGPRPVIFTYFEKDADIILKSLGLFYHFDALPWKQGDVAILENEA